MNRCPNTLMMMLAVAVGQLAANAAANRTVDDEARTAELLRQVEAMETEVASLQAERGAGWLTDARTEEVRSIVHDVLSDAESRASLLQDVATSGWDEHLFLASPDGDFKIEVEGLIQVRYVFNFQDETNPDDANRGGFENSRTKLAFTGHVLDPTWTYMVRGDFETDGGTMRLEEAYIAKQLDDGWAIRVGQFKGPFLREELVESWNQLAADRSMVNERFTQNFMQGVEVSWLDDIWRITAMLSDGIDEANSPWNAYDTEYALTGRVEVRLMGEWESFPALLGRPDMEDALMLGGAIHHQKAEFGTPAGPEDEAAMLAVEGNFLSGPFSMFAAFADEDTDFTDSNPWGVVLQGGYWLTEEWQVYGRFEYGDPDVANEEELMVLTAGVNFFFSPGMRWTTDLGYGLNEVTSTWAAPIVGWREDPSGEDGQVTVRTQLQLSF